MTGDIKKFNWRIPENISEKSVLERIIINRFGKEIDLDEFFNPSFGLADPFLMKGIKAAVERLKLAKQESQKIIIYGDYDADGLTSSALMSELMNFLGLDCQVFIPNRYDYGYGLKEENLQKLSADLIITVDCGIRDHEVIKKFTDKFDFIVTDHHQPGEKLPECVAVIDPHQPDCSYPFKNLAGVGVAYCLARGLLADWGIDREKMNWWLKWNLDLVALGTVTDMMPLVGENRVIVKYGLQVLAKKRRPGLKQLFGMSGRNNDDLTSFDLGFIIGPRLNAVGRLGSAQKGYELLITKDEKLAQKLTLELNGINQKRRAMMDHVMMQIKGEMHEIDKVIMAANPGWLRGIVGLVAGRLVEEYRCPVFLGEIKGEEIIGSARGIGNINVEKLMTGAAEYLLHYGGHEMAGGFSLKKDNWTAFVQAIKDQINSMEIEIDNDLNIDALIDQAEVKTSLWDDLKKIHPLGTANPEPNLLTYDVKVIDKKIIGREKNHTKMVVRLGNMDIDALFWNSAESMKDKNLSTVNLVYNLQESEFNQNINQVINVVDMEESNG